MFRSNCPFCTWVERDVTHEFRGSARLATWRHFDESQICRNLFEVDHDAVEIVEVGSEAEAFALLIPQTIVVSPEAFDALTDLLDGE